MERPDRADVPVETKTCDFCLNTFAKRQRDGHWLQRRFCSPGCRMNHQRVRFGLPSDQAAIGAETIEPAEWRSETKTCPSCNATFGPRVDESQNDWRARIYCGLSCAAKNNAAAASRALSAKPRRKGPFRRRFAPKTCVQCGTKFYNERLKTGKRRFCEKRWETVRYCSLSCSGAAGAIEYHRRRRDQAETKQPTSKWGDLFRALPPDDTVQQAEDEAQAKWLIHLMEGQE
jgi:hypothetical protein